MDDRSNFRYAPGYQVSALQTGLDWSAWNVLRDPLTGDETKPGTGLDLSNGLASAVEMCNNNGHCRKFDAGTMCPSYRITKDEQHVTRGRANTLRLALSGQVGQAGLASAEVKDALDLCVSCKGCKRDCPTGVDMAKIKIEARAAWGKLHGLTLRERLIAFMPHYAPWASRFGSLLSIAEATPGLGALVKRALGFATARSLPKFKAPFLTSTQNINTAASDNTATKTSAKDVLLFVDTFSNYLEAENAHAAQRVLQAAGYTVHLNVRAGERPLCCGRTFLSAGLIDQAKAEARRTLDTLMPYVTKGIAIVGLEPSCLLTLRDEFLHYGYGAEAEQLAQQAFLFEEFLVREQKAGRFKLNLQAIDYNNALLHGHCHQKAFDALTPVQTVLSWIPELKVSTIESSCCGMAGSFGYEAEHHQASMQMAELSLLPAVRNRTASTVVVADGTSCRHQIHDGAEVKAIHTARLLAQALPK
jgi:Fe-S oxidoreductase